jgi:hypothetical protein
MTELDIRKKMMIMKINRKRVPGGIEENQSEIRSRSFRGGLAIDRVKIAWISIMKGLTFFLLRGWNHSKTGFCTQKIELLNASRLLLRKINSFLNGKCREKPATETTVYREKSVFPGYTVTEQRVREVVRRIHQIQRSVSAWLFDLEHFSWTLIVLPFETG